VHIWLAIQQLDGSERVVVVCSRVRTGFNGSQGARACPRIGTNRDMPNSNVPWFAVRVKSRCEWAVADAIRQKGFEEFLPLYWSRRRWSDRVKLLQLPLFPGYLFCRFPVEQRTKVLSVPGVVLIVGNGKVPLAIESSEIESVRTAINSGQGILPWPRLELGRTVRIEEGSLRGLEGVLLRFKGSTHLILGVKLLQRAVAVEVPEQWVIPIAAEKPATRSAEISAH
jgi:transcription termination/antitermination protein NusG